MSGHRYGLWSDLWRVLKLAVLALAVLVVFTALIECVQAYQLLRDVHPAFGWVFLVGLLAAVGWAVAYYVTTLARRPPVLIPPKTCDIHTAGAGELRRFGRYLANVMNRLAGNPLVPEDQQSRLREQATELKAALGNASGARSLATALETAVNDVIVPAIVPLDEEADKRVRNSVRDTTLGVAVSPWRSMDLFVVLYRNGRMVLEISEIYNGRPRLREQLHILADVLKVAATVQFLNIGSKLVENLTSWIPVLGRFTDDIAQGIGAGLFTSVTGHAAIDRCRAFHGWSELEARSGMVPKLKDFMQDLKGIVSDTVMPALKGRIEAETPEERRVPNLMEKVKAGVGEAIDKTCSLLDSFVGRPAAAGDGSPVSPPPTLGERAKPAVETVGRAMAWTGRHGWQLSVTSFRVAGRGLRATGRGLKGATGAVVRRARRKKPPQ